MHLATFEIILVVFAALVFLGIAFWARYKTVGADEAMIVTGSMLGSKNVLTDDANKKIKIIRGGGAFIVPIFQRAEKLSLLSHKLTVSTPEVYTEQGVPIMVDGVAIIKIGGALEDVATAAEQFMGKSDDVLNDEAREVLEGHLRAILGTMTVEEVYKNREKFAQEVQTVAARDLKKMGLQIVSFTIKDVRDKNGYLEALGRPRIAMVRRDADIAEANAIRDTEIQTAKAREEGTKASLISETNIAEAQKNKELRISEFKIEQDMKRAEADQAYHLQENRFKQQVVREQMEIELVKKQKMIELEEKEITRREKQYDAEVRKKADADRYAKEQEAKALRFEQEARALAEASTIKAKGNAEAEAVKAKGLAKAEVEKLEGIAQAEVIRAKGLAEAEAKQKLAEAFESYGQAAVLDLIAKMLPELAKQVAQPLSNIDKLTVVDASGENGQGAAKVSNYVTNLMAQTPEMLKSVSGIDLNQIIQGLTQTNHIPVKSAEPTAKLTEKE
ncbi:flotillin [Laceyella sacchari]|uniref:Flotillin n=2 Tax=Laceyella TaxID=292635 RepID=A0AA46AD33_9BACL|nr:MULTISPECIES: flotillin family protein [Laceyella]AUS08058.1 flotillin [Laceyella sacchari]MRG27068.1 flotillin family protein [Laceyella tengchongensis]PRZ12507.1 flotillin [Laceyella sediminis]SMP02199.1 flotillin [Laceyella tengchongensis]